MTNNDVSLQEIKWGMRIEITMKSDDLNKLYVAKEKYLKEYNPYGYGTRFNTPNFMDGVFVIKGIRSNSCD